MKSFIPLSSNASPLKILSSSVRFSESDTNVEITVCLSFCFRPAHMLIFLDGQRQVSLSSIKNKMKLVLIRPCTVSLCHSVLWAKQRTGFNYVYSFLRRENASWISIFLGTILQPCNFEHLVASLKSNNSLFNKPNVPDCKVC